MNMDNNETNDLVPETGLEETLTDAVTLTAESSEQAETLQESHIEETALPAPTSRQEVIEQLKSLIELVSNDKKERIDFLKQTFYRIQKSEAETKEVLETEKKTDTPQEEGADPLETNLKELLSSWKEKRAGQIAELEKQRQEKKDELDQCGRSTVADRKLS